MTLPHAQVATGIPRKGELLPDFEVLAPGGDLTRISDLRGRKTSVLVMAGQSPADLVPYCRELAASLASFTAEDSVVLVVVEGSSAEAARFAADYGLDNHVFADLNDRAHLLVGSAPAVFVTDRHGEIFAAFYGNAAELPRAHELLKWVQFVNMQCEECFPPEWPV